MANNWNTEDTNQPPEGEPPVPDSSTRQSSDAPEPPARWDPASLETITPVANGPQDGGSSRHAGVVGGVQIVLEGSDAADFESARRLTRAAYICIFISIFIGGILLSSAALICAAIAYSKLSKIASLRNDEAERRALRRSGMTAVIIAIIVLVFNIAAIVFLYPLVVDTLNSGGLFPFDGSGVSTGSGHRTWG